MESFLRRHPAVSILEYVAEHDNIQDTSKITAAYLN